MLSANLVMISMLTLTGVSVILLARMAIQSRSQTGRRRPRSPSAASRTAASQPSQRGATSSPDTDTTVLRRAIQEDERRTQQTGEQSAEIDSEKTRRKSKFPATFGKFLNNTSCRLSPAS